MKTFYVFSLQGFPTLLTDNHPPDNSFHATHLTLLSCTLDGTNWSATVVTMLVSKQQCCFELYHINSTETLTTLHFQICIWPLWDLSQPCLETISSQGHWSPAEHWKIRIKNVHREMACILHWSQIPLKPPSLKPKEVVLLYTCYTKLLMTCVTYLR